MKTETKTDWSEKYLKKEHWFDHPSCVIAIALFFPVSILCILGLLQIFGTVEEKSYENVQQIRMYQPDEVTIFVKMPDKKLVSINFKGVHPIIIEDAPVDGLMRVEYKNCDANGMRMRECLEMHVHSLDEVESWKQITIPLPYD